MKDTTLLLCPNCQQPLVIQLLTSTTGKHPRYIQRSKVICSSCGSAKEAVFKRLSKLQNNKNNSDIS